MSLYRTILEEEQEVPILDDDNSPEIKEIEDVVADQDANAFEQDEAQEAEFGTGMGGPGPEDALDEMCMAIAECQMADNEIMMSIGIMEAGKLGRTGQIIYEAVDIKGFFKKIKDWVVKFFKKVWQVLQRYFQNISSTFHTNQGFLKKYGGKLAEGLKAYKALEKDGMKMYSFSGLKAALTADKDTTAMKKLDNAFGSNLKQIKDSTYDDSRSLSADDMEEYMDAIRGDYLGTSGNVTTSEFREKLMNLLHNGSADNDNGKEEGYMTPEDIKAFMGESAKKALDKAKKALDKSKAECKNEIKKINTFEKQLSSKTYKDGEDAKQKSDSAKLKVVQNYKSCMEGVLSIVQISRACILTASRQAMIQARVFGQAYIYALNKKNPKYKGFQDESAGYGYLSGVSLV